MASRPAAVCAGEQNSHCLVNGHVHERPDRWPQAPRGRLLCKPFSPRELLAASEASCRVPDQPEEERPAASCLVFEGWHLDRARRTLRDPQDLSSSLRPASMTCLWRLPSIRSMSSRAISFSTSRAAGSAAPSIAALTCRSAAFAGHRSRSPAAGTHKNRPRRRLYFLYPGCGGRRKKLGVTLMGFFALKPPVRLGTRIAAMTLIALLAVQALNAAAFPCCGPLRCRSIAHAGSSKRSRMRSRSFSLHRRPSVGTWLSRQERRATCDPLAAFEKQNPASPSNARLLRP